jgi:hypothetical protein
MILRSHCHLLVSVTVDLDRAPSTALPLPVLHPSETSAVEPKHSLRLPFVCMYSRNRRFAAAVSQWMDPIVSQKCVCPKVRTIGNQLSLMFPGLRLHRRVFSRNSTVDSSFLAWDTLLGFRSWWPLIWQYGYPIEIRSWESRKANFARAIPCLLDGISFTT